MVTGTPTFWKTSKVSLKKITLVQSGFSDVLILRCIAKKSHGQFTSSIVYYVWTKEQIFKKKNDSQQAFHKNYGLCDSHSWWKHPDIAIVLCRNVRNTAFTLRREKNAMETEFFSGTNVNIFKLHRRAVWVWVPGATPLVSSCCGWSQTDSLRADTQRALLGPLHSNLPLYAALRPPCSFHKVHRVVPPN